MVQPMDFVIICLFIFFVQLVAFSVWFYIYLHWNIPVALLRFVGNKGRPTLILKKGKKKFINGVPHLYIQGYDRPVRDYLSENYYPTIKGKYGGLILWEFEDGLLAPAIPESSLKKMTEDEKKVYEEAKAYFTSKSVPFNFDKQTFKDLKLKVVDDVDQEFMLQEQSRVEDQYSGGWKDFLLKYGGHITVIVIAVMMLVGVIVWLDKAPEFAAQCAATARDVVKASLVEQAASQVAPPA